MVSVIVIVHLEFRILFDKSLVTFYRAQVAYFLRGSGSDVIVYSLLLSAFIGDQRVV